MKHAVGSHRVGVNATHDSLGRSTGYVYSKNGATQQTVTTGYGTDGRIASAGFLHGGAEKQFSYEYLPGTHLLQKLTLPSNMTLTQSYEPHRDLLTGMCYKRSNTTVAERTYTYDALGRPLTRTTARNGQTVTDSFGYNNRSELTTATVNGGSYAYDYDNIGNRAAAVEDSSGVASRTTYTSNELNQYTSLSVDGLADFQPEYDADGNQTRVKTSTGIWAVIYNAENRPTDFYKIDESGSTTVKCTYDHMGRRATKLVTVNGNVTLHQRYIYRGYLQIACIDLTRSHHPALWYITWDPTQPIATRPLAIQKDGTWYTYGWDLTKNICEVYGQHGYIRTAYTYTPYGQVTASGDTEQPIQWSSEFNDTELGLVYYNYRHYNPVDGRWICSDFLQNEVSYLFISNEPSSLYDVLGLSPELKFLNEPEKSILQVGDVAGEFKLEYKGKGETCKKAKGKYTVRIKPELIRGIIILYKSEFRGLYSKYYNKSMNQDLIKLLNILKRRPLTENLLKTQCLFKRFYTRDGVFIHEYKHFEQAYAQKEEIIEHFPEYIETKIRLDFHSAEELRKKSDNKWAPVPDNIAEFVGKSFLIEKDAYQEEWNYYIKENDSNRLLIKLS